MNTEQIIKGLEESVKKIEAYYDSKNTPKEKRSIEGKKALKLIKELLAENTGLKTALETLRGVAESYEHHNENLKKENKYLRERLAEEAEIKEDMSVSELKAEIERLNKEVDKRVPKLIITKKPKGAGNV